MTSAGRDLYRLLEEEVRTPRETILLDAFLPPPAAIPSVFADPPAPAAEQPPAGATISQILGRSAPGEEPEEAPSPRPRRKPVRKREERQKTIEEEIAGFTSRDNSPLPPDKDP